MLRGSERKGSDPGSWYREPTSAAIYHAGGFELRSWASRNQERRHAGTFCCVPRGALPGKTPMSRTEREKRSAKRKQPVNLYLQRVTVKVYQHATNT